MRVLLEQSRDCRTKIADLLKGFLGNLVIIGSEQTLVLSGMV